MNNDHEDIELDLDTLDTLIVDEFDLSDAATQQSREASDRRGAYDSGSQVYSARVHELLDRLGSDLTTADFVALAVACADQAGAHLGVQASIERLLSTVRS